MKRVIRKKDKKNCKRQEIKKDGNKRRKTLTENKKTSMRKKTKSIKKTNKRENTDKKKITELIKRET